MRWILGLFGALVFVGGFIEIIAATTVLQQIFAAVILCWSGVLFVGSAILEGLRSNEKILEDILAKGNRRKALSDDVSEDKRDLTNQSPEKAPKIEYKDRWVI